MVWFFLFSHSRTSIPEFYICIYHASRNRCIRRHHHQHWVVPFSHLAILKNKVVILYRKIKKNMTTHDLTRQEFDELKESYFQQLKDTNPDVLGDITNWEELSDNFIHEHYEGWWFEREDFVCNNPQTLLD